MSITYKSVYRAKEGKVKKRLDLLIDMDLALKLIEEASRKYGARGISRFIEELLREYFERQKEQTLSEIVENVVQWKNEDWRAGGCLPLKYVEKDPKNVRSLYITADGVEKQHVHVLLSKDVAEKLFIYAGELYGRGRGGVSQLVEQALREFFEKLEKYEKEAILLKSSRRSTVKEVFLQVLKKIAEKWNCSITEILEITDKDLMNAIAEVRGSDKRTIDKWITLFTRWGLLTLRGGMYGTRIFRINHEKLE